MKHLRERFRNQRSLDEVGGTNHFEPMSKAQKQPAKPERPTKGAQIGARLRARTNSLSAEEREAARLRGMQLIYGNAGGKKVHAPSR